MVERKTIVFQNFKFADFLAILTLVYIFENLDSNRSGQAILQHNAHILLEREIKEVGTYHSNILAGVVYSGPSPWQRR